MQRGDFDDDNTEDAGSRKNREDKERQSQLLTKIEKILNNTVLTIAGVLNITQADGLFLARKKADLYKLNHALVRQKEFILNIHVRRYQSANQRQACEQNKHNCKQNHQT